MTILSAYFLGVVLGISVSVVFVVLRGQEMVDRLLVGCTAGLIAACLSGCGSETPAPDAGPAAIAQDAGSPDAVAEATAPSPDVQSPSVDARAPEIDAGSAVPLPDAGAPETSPVIVEAGQNETSTDDAGDAGALSPDAGPDSDTPDVDAGHNVCVLLGTGEVLHCVDGGEFGFRIGSTFDPCGGWIPACPGTDPCYAPGGNTGLGGAEGRCR